MGLFFAHEIEVGAYVEEVDADGDDVPKNHGAGGDEEAIEDPENLKGAHDGCHFWVDTGAGAAPEHLEQVWQGGKSGAESGDQADYLRALNMRIEQAGPVVGCDVTTTAKDIDTDGDSGKLEVPESRHGLDLSFYAGSWVITETRETLGRVKMRHGIAYARCQTRVEMQLKSDSLHFGTGRKGGT